MSFAAKATTLSAAVMFLFSIASPTFAINKPATNDSTVQQKPKITETQVIEWPEGAGWKLANTYTSGSSIYELYYPKDQGYDNWQEMVTLEIVQGKGKGGINLPGLARMTYLGTRKGSPNATWDILQKGYSGEAKDYPFILYEIDCPDFLSKEPAQVQLWKMTEGKTALFNLQYSYRGKEMPGDKKEEIMNTLKNSYIKAEPADTAKK